MHENLRLKSSAGTGRPFCAKMNEKLMSEWMNERINEGRKEVKGLIKFVRPVAKG